MTFIGTKIFKVYKPLILLLYINSMYPWYAWNNIVAPVMTIVTAMVSLVFFFQYDGIKQLKKVPALVVLLTILAVFQFTRGNINQVYAGVCTYFVWISIISLKDSRKKEIINFIVKWLSIIVLISLVCYIINLLGFVKLPSVMVEYEGSWYKGLNYYTFVSVNDGRLENFARFQGIFLEAGHLTMGLIPLIMINRFNVRNKYVALLVIEQFFTFSLAGFVCLLVGYILFNFNSKLLLKGTVAAILVVSAFWAINAAGYGRIIDVFVWKRLEVKNGKLAGDNRTTRRFDRQYEQVLASEDVFFGRTDWIDDYGDGGNSGYKVAVVKDGIFGVFLSLLVYTYYAMRRRTYHVCVVTLIYLLLLTQNAYFVWFCVIGSYLLGMPVIDSPPDEKKEDRKKPGFFKTLIKA